MYVSLRKAYTCNNRQDRNLWWVIGPTEVCLLIKKTQEMNRNLNKVIND